MTYKEFIRKSDNVRRKRDIILLSELLDLYDEYYKSKKKEPIEPIIIYSWLFKLFRTRNRNYHTTSPNIKKWAKSITDFAFLCLTIIKNRHFVI